MSLSEDQNADFENAAEASLESRAMALVNPASGLANDFLNVYNEILMLIELLPTMPELADDIAAWRPASYRAYFMQSPLPGSREALAVYARLEPAFRNLFEANVERLAECSVGAVDAIARAVANAPRALLADEPTGNLDPQTAEHVFNALMQLVRATRVAMLIATHNMELASRMDRRVSLADGQVVELD